jgi:hypothetical protein
MSLTELARVANARKAIVEDLEVRLPVLRDQAEARRKASLSEVNALRKDLKALRDEIVPLTISTDFRDALCSLLEPMTPARSRRAVERGSPGGSQRASPITRCGALQCGR